MANEVCTYKKQTCIGLEEYKYPHCHLLEEYNLLGNHILVNIVELHKVLVQDHRKMAHKGFHTGLVLGLQSTLEILGE